MRRLAALVVALTACEGRGSLDVAWTVGEVDPRGDAFVCSRHGIDVVEVVTLYAGSTDAHADGRFPCGAGLGRMGGLAPATVDVRVFGLAPGYDALVGPVTVTGVVIEEDAVAEAAVDLRPPDSCEDGADNDHDGRADAADDDCAAGGPEGGATAHDAD